MAATARAARFLLAMTFGRSMMRRSAESRIPPATAPLFGAAARCTGTRRVATTCRREVWCSVVDKSPGGSLPRCPERSCPGCGAAPFVRSPSRASRSPTAPSPRLTLVAFVAFLDDDDTSIRLAAQLWERRRDERRRPCSASTGCHRTCGFPTGSRTAAISGPPNQRTSTGTACGVRRHLQRADLPRRAGGAHDSRWTRSGRVRQQRRRGHGPVRPSQSRGLHLRRRRPVDRCPRLGARRMTSGILTARIPARHSRVDARPAHLPARAGSPPGLEQLWESSVRLCCYATPDLEPLPARPGPARRHGGTGRALRPRAACATTSTCDAEDERNGPRRPTSGRRYR